MKAEKYFSSKKVKISLQEFNSLLDSLDFEEDGYVIDRLIFAPKEYVDSKRNEDCEYKRVRTRRKDGTSTITWKWVCY